MGYVSSIQGSQESESCIGHTVKGSLKNCTMPSAHEMYDLVQPLLVFPCLGEDVLVPDDTWAPTRRACLILPPDVLAPRMASSRRSQEAPVFCCQSGPARAVQSIGLVPRNETGPTFCLRLKSMVP